jgi:hypothetical protein
MLEQIQDERVLESIYWNIERKLVQNRPRN